MKYIKFAILVLAMSFDSFAFASASSAQTSEVSYITAESQENSAETNDNEISWSTLDYSLAITGGVVGGIVGGGTGFLTSILLANIAIKTGVLPEHAEDANLAQNVGLIGGVLGIPASGLYFGAKFGKNAGLWLSKKISSDSNKI